MAKNALTGAISRMVRAFKRRLGSSRRRNIVRNKRNEVDQSSLGDYDIILGDFDEDEQNELGEQPQPLPEGDFDENEQSKMGLLPQPLPEGLFDYSCPYSNHALLGVEQENVDRMRSTSNTVASFLSDNCVRGITLHLLPEESVSERIAFFDPQWLAMWTQLPLNVREHQFWNAFPRPLVRTLFDEEIERIVLPINIRQRHWMVIVLDLQNREILLYDSMPTIRNTYTCLQATRMFGDIFHSFLGGPNWMSEFKVRLPNVMVQDDAISCGVLTILYLVVLLQDVNGKPEEIYPSSRELVNTALLRELYSGILERIVNR